MQTTFSIPGIHCASCAALIKDVSSEFPAITSIDVDIDRKTVSLMHGDDFIVDGWKNAIEELGQEYKVLIPNS